MTDALQIATTVENQQTAATIARTLVERRLAACVQIVGPIRSVYRWQGKIETAEEWQCLVKTTRQRYPAVEQAIRELHPYDVPETLAIAIEAGDPAYLQWLEEQVAE